MNSQESMNHHTALILIATWYRQGPAMTQQFNVNHGHPDGDLLTSILAYEWFLANKRTYSHKYGDWQTNLTQEWKACSKVGLIHHVMVAIHESVLVLKHTFDEHRLAFPEVPKRQFGSPGYSSLLLHSVWTSFFDRCLIKLPTGEYVSPLLSQHKCKGIVPIHTVNPCMLWHVPSLLLLLCPVFHVGTSSPLCAFARRTEEWAPCKGPPCHKRAQDHGAHVTLF